MLLPLMLNSNMDNINKTIRTDDHLEKVILSKPLTIIHYDIEMPPLRPDYNLPAKDLSIQSGIVFQERVALWLLKLKVQQPERRFVYYIGAPIITSYFFGRI